MELIQNECQYCGRQYRTVKGFDAHSCKLKLRYESANKKEVKIGFQGFVSFYKRSINKDKTYTDFVKSPYYQAFISWGRYVTEIRAIAPEAFLNYLLDNNKKIDQWCRDNIYETFLLEHLLKESVADALTRSIETSLQWAQRTNMQSHDILRYGNPNGTVYYITTGRISPWALYNCVSGQYFLNNLNVEQLSIVLPYIDPDKWNAILMNNSVDKLYAEEILEKAGW